MLLFLLMKIASDFASAFSSDVLSKKRKGFNLKQVPIFKTSSHKKKKMLFIILDLYNFYEYNELKISWEKVL